MDHREFLSSLTAQERLALTTRTNKQGVLRVAAIIAVITTLVLGIQSAPPGWPLLCLPLGIVLVFLFTLMHETTHETVFTSKWLNRAVASACGFVLLIPPQWFLHFHLAHHRHTQDPNLDPELASAKPQRVSAYLVHLSGMRVWHSAVKTLLTNALGRCQDNYIHASIRHRIQLEALIMCGLYTVIFAAMLHADNPLMLWIWVVPLLLGQPFLRLFLLAEHGNCAPSDDPRTRNMFATTRTTFTTTLVRLLSWNMSYHTEHHVYPTVPFHRLPDLHVRINQYLLNTSTGYRSFHRHYVAQLP